MGLLNVRDFGAVGNGTADDTLAFRNAGSYLASNLNKYQSALWVPSGTYLLSDGVHPGASGPTADSQNQQGIQITGNGTSFTLNVTVGSLIGTSFTTLSIGYTSGNFSANATAIQNALTGWAGIGAGNATVVYDPTHGWYTVTFAASLGAPVMTASGANLTITITVLQSGAALIFSNIYGLRLVGDGSALADYDQQGNGTVTAPSSRSALIWNGTANGVLLHLLGCNNATLENVALWGATTTPPPANQARTGLLFSCNLMNPTSPTDQRGGSGLTCRSFVSTRFASKLASNDPNLSANPSGCIQLGMNENDVGADTTVYQASMLTNGTNGLLVVSSSSVNHYIQGCGLGTLANGLFFQQGGNLSADGLKVEGLVSGSAGGTVLKIGPGSEGPAYGFYAGGVNASTFLLRNVRTNPLSGPNITLVDATYGGPATQITIDGWDDSAASSTDTTPALILAASTSVNLRHSLVSRPVLAKEATVNAPTAAMTAALRMENLIVPEYNLAAALCSALTLNTKVDLVGERTSIYNVVRPDRSGMFGRPFYSAVDWLIEQQNPKYFYPLGDVGAIAGNLGWNLYISPTIPRSDGAFVSSVFQNVQKIVNTDAIGGFNTRASGTAGTGYVSLNTGNLNIGPLSGKNWTLIAVVKRNAGTSSNFHPILWNLASSASGGGLQLAIDDTKGSAITFTMYNGSTSIGIQSNSTFGPTSTVSIYIMIQVAQSGSTGTLDIYLEGNTTHDVPTVNFTTPAYIDNSIWPLIGASANGSTVADLQIARLATFDFLVPLSAWSNLYYYGNQYRGR